MLKGNYKSVREAFQVYLPPAVGYSFLHLMHIIFRYGVQFKYFPRALVIVLISIIGIPFRLFENLWYHHKIRHFPIPEKPVFIIGHWRSGTTYLHNIMTRDPRMGYVTTYQGVFPNNVFQGLGRWIFRSFMQLLIPVNRKGDNVKLGVDFPQEEEFALGAGHSTSFYYFWYFPNKIRKFYRDSIEFSGSPEQHKERFRKTYVKIIKKAMMRSGKSIFISKNPPNTGRVKLLLEAFPDARFIFIYRNPVNVILSTRNFFDKMMPALWFRDLSPGRRKEEIFELYNKILNKYESEKKDVPQTQLFEVRFEDFERDPLPILKEIYAKLNISGYEEVLPQFEQFFSKARKYRKNEYSISKANLNEILEHTREQMERYGYGVPEGIKIA